MTGTSDPDDAEWNGGWYEPAEPPRQKGLSAGTVEELRKVILGSEYSSEPSRLRPETVDQMHRMVLFGEEPPPRTPAGRFGKGSSGNLKGRPKRLSETAPILPPPPGAASLGAITLRHVLRSVKALTGDGEVVMTMLEAIITKTVQESAKGNTGHTRTLMLVVAKAEAAAAAHRRDLFCYWSERKEVATKVWTDAKRAGRPKPVFVHPDDIRLSADGTVTIVGPTEPDAIEAMRYTHRRVEYHLINIAYQEWLRRRWERSHGRPAPEGRLYAELAFEVEQGELPPRLRLGADEMLARKAPYAALPGRALHARLKQEANSFGLRVPPREERKPVIIDREFLESAERNGISKRRMLAQWLLANEGAVGPGGQDGGTT